MDLGLTGKAVLVTAASKGLGKAAAMEMARNGARVAICSRSSAVDQAADDIRTSTGATVHALHADLTRREDVDRVVSSTLERLGQLDILIINAGGPPPGSFLELGPQDWEAAVRLTLLSAVYLCYAVVPHMLERGEGSILATQSISVRQPLDNLILSNSLRMAVIGLMKSLANELGPKGIRVNSINPGWTRTERVDQLLIDRAARNGTSVADEAARVTRGIPLGRMGTVEEYGRAVAWLASPAASYIDGHALSFDGGAIQASL
ncbi:MAG: SDR family oxidoreductase [Chloroflexi bacterium]|nr:SDR family oxidoreductase [Chloroflexota bacterium]